MLKGAVARAVRPTRTRARARRPGVPAPAHAHRTERWAARVAEDGVAAAEPWTLAGVAQVAQRRIERQVLVPAGAGGPVRSRIDTGVRQVRPRHTGAQASNDVVRTVRPWPCRTERALHAGRFAVRTWAVDTACA